MDILIVKQVISCENVNVDRLNKTISFCFVCSKVQQYSISNNSICTRHYLKKRVFQIYKLKLHSTRAWRTSLSTTFCPNTNK